MLYNQGLVYDDRCRFWPKVSFAVCWFEALPWRIFFSIDLMHLFGCNVGPQIARLITTGDFSIDKRHQHLLRLTNKDVQSTNSLLRSSYPLVPTIFSGVMENIESGYNCAVDWIHFLRHILPTTVASFFDKATRQKIVCISKICNPACQRDIQQPKESTMMPRLSLYAALMVRNWSLKFTFQMLWWPLHKTWHQTVYLCWFDKQQQWLTPLFIIKFIYWKNPFIICIIFVVCIVKYKYSAILSHIKDLSLYGWHDFWQHPDAEIQKKV